MIPILLLSCAALLAALDPSNISDPYAGETCSPGPWSISCPACSPPLSETVVVSCVGVPGDGMAPALEVALPGGLEGWRSNNTEADLTVGEE